MGDRIQLDLPILLPDVPDAEDACVERLTESLQDRAGIDRVHVTRSENDESDRLCVHYVPEVVSLPRIRQTAKSVGTEITDQYGHLVGAVEGISHPRRARTIAKRLRRIDGVLEAEASASERIRVEYNCSVTGESEIRTVLRSMGVRLRGDVIDVQDVDTEGEEHPEDAGHDHGGIFGERTELIFAMLSGGCVALGFGLSFIAAMPTWGTVAIYGAGYFFGGYYTVREAVDALRMGEFEVDFLMLVAAAGAAILGKWLEGAFLLFLFSLGHALEHYAMGRARQAIERLAELAPDTALVWREGEEVEVPVEELAVGDTILVKPGARIPADGVVVRGESAVDQSPVTGESVPVDKAPVENPEAALETSEALDSAHRVYAGTINGNSALEVQVTARSDETTISRVVQMVTEAEAEKSPTERFTDRFERIFVPSVLGLVVLLLFAWVPLDETFAESFYRAMAVLVAASPCALAIATPSAVLSGVARAGQRGVLVKGGGPLEQLGRLGAVAFDKTGTLTEGEPRVTDVWTYEGTSEADVLRTAIAVERLSDHPLAEAVVQYGEKHLDGAEVGDASDVESVTGRGVKATVNGTPVYVGKNELFDENGISLPGDIRKQVESLESEGRTTMILRRGERFLGVIGLADALRADAAEMIERLRGIGIRRLIMISGDNQRVVDAVASQLGIDEARGDLLPGDKVEVVRRLREEEDVAMVGDGVNDAPAMANASVGIAMGAAGSDVALETADVALMADDLEPLPFAVGLSRQTRRVIQQNLWLALGMVAILVPATIFGLQIGPAVVLHEGSTLLVVGNALRLLRYEA